MPLFYAAAEITNPAASLFARLTSALPPPLSGIAREKTSPLPSEKPSDLKAKAINRDLPVINDQEHIPQRVDVGQRVSVNCDEVGL